MREQSFSIWLSEEVTTARHAMLILLEKRDRLLYTEAPALRQEYMEKIGAFEEEVLEAELQVNLLERKSELIQAAMNRREAIDLDAINRQIDEEREGMLTKMEEDSASKEVPALTEEEQEKLQEMYHDIIRDFHPQMHTDVTEIQKDLYEKAQSAYQRQNLEALDLIHQMLYDDSNKLTCTFSVSVVEQIEEKAEEETLQELVDTLFSDYSLAAKVFPCFELSEEDAVLKKNWEDCREEYKKLQSEIDAIKADFPFNAKETLRSPQKAEEYREHLRRRLKNTEEEKEKWEQKIGRMIGAGIYG